MGCDIHEHYEICTDNIWADAGIFPKINWETIDSEEEDATLEKLSNHPASIWRNYVLFSVLADVRNSFGIRPISEPRGIPQNVSKELGLEWSEVEVYCHHASWLGLNELLDFDWDQAVDEHHDRKDITCREAVEPFTTRTLPYLAALVDDPTKLRIVFWFDN